MTAINIVRLPEHERIFVLSDGAHYGPDGALQGIGTKVMTASHWPGIITSRGATIPAAILSRHLTCAFETFDLMVSGIEASLPEFVGRYSFNDWEPAKQTELIIVGWSKERGRPESYVININDELPAGPQNPKGILPRAYKLQELPAVVSGPAIFGTSLADDFNGIRVSGPMEDVIQDMVIAIEIQRRLIGVSDGFKDYSLVGGFAELTIIRPQWIEQSVLRRWPDKIGEKIRAS